MADPRFRRTNNKTIMIEYKEMNNYFKSWRLLTEVVVFICFLGFFNLTWARDSVTIREDIKKQKDQLQILELRNTHTPSAQLKISIASTLKRIKSLEEDLEKALEREKPDHAIEAPSEIPRTSALPIIDRKHTRRLLRPKHVPDATTPTDDMADLLSGSVSESGCLSAAGGTVFPAIERTARAAQGITRRVR